MTVLRGDPQGFLNHFGLKCSSWTSVNSGTSARSICSSVGMTDYCSVAEANLMASRKLACTKQVFLKDKCYFVFTGRLHFKGVLVWLKNMFDVILRLQNRTRTTAWNSPEHMNKILVLSESCINKRTGISKQGLPLLVGFRPLTKKTSSLPKASKICFSKTLIIF